MVEMHEKDKKVLLNLKTESQNPRTLNLDLMDIGELLTVMNEEDRHAIDAVKQAIPNIRKTVEAVIRALKAGGRLIYVGAGTSGRLGILDAAECLPTFSITGEVLGVIAGGEKAFVHAQEGVEDSKAEAKEDLKELGVNERDVVVALSASGRTPYCIGALEFAREAGACCVGLSCNHPAELSGYSDIAIEVDTGPEILTGSTRLKAGTAQKVILNMISTASMVGVGKVYGNLMVDMQATNLKLEERARQIVSMACGCGGEKAKEALLSAGGEMKTAIVMILAGVPAKEARERLVQNQGFVRKCLKGGD